MSRRREATDLARALALSTQPAPTSSSTSLRDSSPPITPLPTKYIPQKPINGHPGTGGFMEQYHQQLQQAQSYYQQNPGILAPPSHASRQSYARNPGNRPAPQQSAYEPSGRPSLTSAKSSNSHISDSNRSIVGAISLPDSGYHYPASSRDLAPYSARRDHPFITSSTLNPVINRTAPAPAIPSSGLKSSLSADSGTQFCVPPGQPQKSPLHSTITSSSPSLPVGHQSVRTPQVTSTGRTVLPSNPASSTSDRSSVINTAPPITPVSSDSKIVSFSNSVGRSALEPTFKTTVGAPVRQINGATTGTGMATADDIVADSEGEEDDAGIVQGTQDGLLITARSKQPESAIGGLGTGLMTPPITESNTVSHSTSSAMPSALPLQTPSTKSPSSAKETVTSAIAQDATESRPASPMVPVSTRPKPKRRTKPSTDGSNPAVVANTATPASSTSVPPPSKSNTGAPATIQQISAESVNRDPDTTKKPPVKTYGSKNKSDGTSGKSATSRSKEVQEEERSRKGSLSKRRNVVGSDSEFSDAGQDSIVRNKKAGNSKDQQSVTRDADGGEAPLQNVKRNGKKRAIIASDDETEEEQLQTPDSKRRKAEGDSIPAPRSPSKKAGRPRDSSVDPLDMDVDHSMSSKDGRMEVSIELSPSNSVKDLMSSTRLPAEAEKPAGVKTKSPNKVHFVDPPTNEEETAAKPAVSKKSKSVSRVDDDYGEVPEAIPVMDEDDEDDFVPSGSKKAKAKAKATKAKKAAAAKEKTAKGKKASQAKGKKGKVADVVAEPVQPSLPAPEAHVAEASNPPLANEDINNATADKTTVPTATAAEAAETTAAVPAKGKVKRIVVVGKKAPKSAEIIVDDEPTTPKAGADVVSDGVPLQAPIPAEPDAAKDAAVAEQPARVVQGKKAGTARKKVVSDSESEKEVEKETAPVVNAQPAISVSRVLQPKASSAANSPAGVKIEPSFVVDKNGNVKEFRTCRTDLPKVVQTTGGVKRIGFSRRSTIPSLHKSIKAPPKRLPPPPKKPSRKKEDSDDDSDEFDENGKKKIRPGDPEWYMMDVD